MCTRFTSLPKTLAFITTDAEELLPPEGNVLKSVYCPNFTASSIWFLNWRQSLVSYPQYLRKWKYLDMSRDRLLPNAGGGYSKLLAAFSMARISLGILDRLESSPWLGPWYGENLSLPFYPWLLSQEDFLGLSKFSLQSLGVPLVATSLASI
ncbi:hypothetical protein Tco_0540957 [Tanacetum coccineum]